MQPINLNLLSGCTVFIIEHEKEVLPITAKELKANGCEHKLYAISTSDEVLIQNITA